MRSQEKRSASYNPITEGVIWKQLLLFFFPLVFGSLFQQVYNTVDTIVVGRFVGKEALAAVGGSASQIVNVAVGFFVGLSSGASVIVAQYYGAKDGKNLSRTMHTAVAFAALAGLFASVAGILAAEKLLILMHTPADSLQGAVVYLRIYFLGMTANLLYNMGAGVLRALGDSRRPLYVLIVTCVLNVLLDILFVVIIPLGVAGVALATILCQTISAILVLGILFRTKEIYRLEARKVSLQGKYLKSILRIGVPAGLESITYAIANVLIQVFVNNLGTDTVAAWSTLGKIDAMYWLMMNAFSISITTFVGQNYGAGRIDRMRKSVRQCLLMAWAGGGLVILVFYFAGDFIFGLFTTDAAVISIGVHMLHFMMRFYLIYVVIGILFGALRGAGRVLIPMLFSLFGICGIRIIWLFGVVAKHPTVDNIMLNYPVSWIITAVLYIIYYFMSFPKERKSL